MGGVRQRMRALEEYEKCTVACIADQRSDAAVVPPSTAPSS